MISELKQRSWLVATNPQQPQYYGGQCDGASKFYVDWRMGIPLTHIEALQVATELELMFSKHSENFGLVWLGDVAK